MGNAQKALVMAAGIFLAIALITIGVVMFISAQEATKTAQENFSSIQNELSSTSFTVYDNTIISGSQVINALNKFNKTKEFGIRVVTNEDLAGTWYGDIIDAQNPASTTYGDVAYRVTGSEIRQPDGTTLVSGATGYSGTVAQSLVSQASLESSNRYVNTAGKFHATVVRDSSNVIHGLLFDQTN
ncbi:ABC transporter permease [Tumebacillus permanentifrigoris]|uniref:ABC transporter permease n=1 Tax=Tumebacillus permanentifrigoris TaxID=378543 RepID=A0A316D6S3_9BACL|nr:ABC transporter permease [Tumebacillus permanentifrigoris]PWK05009.1 hypothetical protein C7459_1297 [Tumebacillus permanentifrigoris]